MYKFVDVLSTDDWALEMVPGPAKAVMLLFPISEMVCVLWRWCRRICVHGVCWLCSPRSIAMRRPPPSRRTARWLQTASTTRSKLLATLAVPSVSSTPSPTAVTCLAAMSLLVRRRFPVGPALRLRCGLGTHTRPSCHVRNRAGHVFPQLHHTHQGHVA